jgi:hypothetical protein
MAKPYVPTGRPPGRPPKPAVERQAIPDVRVRLADRTADRRFMPMNAFCPDCFPEGFPAGVRSLNCPHGTWVSRL